MVTERGKVDDVRPFEQSVEVHVHDSVIVLVVEIDAAEHVLLEYTETYTLLDESAVYVTYDDADCGMHVPRGTN